MKIPRLNLGLVKENGAIIAQSISNGKLQENPIPKKPVLASMRRKIGTGLAIKVKKGTLTPRLTPQMTPNARSPETTPRHTPEVKTVESDLVKPSARRK